MENYREKTFDKGLITNDKVPFFIFATSISQCWYERYSLFTESIIHLSVKKRISFVLCLSNIPISTMFFVKWF